jgi:glucokinase
MMDNCIIGVDIGGTKTAVCITAEPKDLMEKPFIIDRMMFPTPLGIEYPSALGIIIESIKALSARNGVGTQQIKVIGISCGGPVDSVDGLILNPPNLYGWNHVPIVDFLTEELKTTVKLQNDANACALAEWRYGAGRGTKNMVFLTMGTGMGAGFILNGKLYAGANGMAGEIGHIRLSSNGPVGYGKAGSFEGFCSGGGIAQLARTKAMEKLQVGQTVRYCTSLHELDAITAKSVADAADAGDLTARDTYRTCGTYLGRGLSVLIDILNPELIVIGSIFVKSYDLIWENTLAEIQKETIGLNASVCKVVQSELGSSIGDYGAITVALYNEDD